MKASDFRIGNIVYSKINGLSKVEQVGHSLCHNYTGGRSLAGNFWENNYFPVELSVKWFVYFGFKKTVLTDNSGHFYTLDLNDDIHCDLCFCSNDKNGYIELVLFPYEDFFRYKYVHELQNLYFSLTGTELKLNMEL